MVSKEEFDNFCTGKTIVVVGNSPTLLDTEYGDLIDSHDIVLRFNYIVPFLHKKQIGKRTDIWAMSPYPVKVQKIYSRILQKRKYTIRTSAYAGDIIPEMRKDLYHFPFESYWKVYKKYNNHMILGEAEKKIFIRRVVDRIPLEHWIFHEHKKPTSGCVALHYFTKNIQFKSLTIVGFDFLKNMPSLYYKERSLKGLVGPHDSQREEHLITEMIKGRNDISFIK